MSSSGLLIKVGKIELGGHELLEGRALHPVQELQAGRAHFLAEALPHREGCPEALHVAAPRRVLEPAGLRVLILRRGTVPFRAEPAPELKTALIAAAGANAGAGDAGGFYTVWRLLRSDAPGGEDRPGVLGPVAIQTL